MKKKKIGFEWVYMITSFVTHTHTKKKKKMLLMVTYVINGLNESTQSLVLSYTYNFNNSSLRKQNYVIQPKNDLKYDEGYWI